MFQVPDRRLENASRRRDSVTVTMIWSGLIPKCEPNAFWLAVCIATTFTPEAVMAIAPLNLVWETVVVTVVLDLAWETIAVTVVLNLAWETVVVVVVLTLVWGTIVVRVVLDLAWETVVVTVVPASGDCCALHPQSATLSIRPLGLKVMFCIEEVFEELRGQLPNMLSGTRGGE
jgi:hypothetical protein